jgi:hypothetical protein
MDDQGMSHIRFARPYIDVSSLKIISLVKQQSTSQSIVDHETDTLDDEDDQSIEEGYDNRDDGWAELGREEERKMDEETDGHWRWNID